MFVADVWEGGKGRKEGKKSSLSHSCTPNLEPLVYFTQRFFGDFEESAEGKEQTGSVLGRFLDLENPRISPKMEEVRPCTLAHTS